MVLATVRMMIPTDKRAEAIQILKMTAESTRIQMGCLSYHIYHDAQVEGAFMVEEVWESQEALNRHLRSDNYRKMLLVAEMAIEAPAIEFLTVTQSGGLEIIGKARGVRTERSSK